MEGEWKNLVSILETCQDSTLSHQTSLVAAVLSMVLSHNMQLEFVMTYQFTPPSDERGAATLYVRFDKPIRASLSMLTACTVAIGPLFVKDIIVLSECEWSVEFYKQPEMPTRSREPMIIMVSRTLRPVAVVTPEQQHAMVAIEPEASHPISRPGSKSILQRIGWSWSLFGKDDEAEEEDPQRESKKRKTRD